MGQRVLVIDDSEAIHQLVAAWLRHEPVETRSTRTTTAGHTLASSWRPDLILLDVNMPDMNGFDFCRLLKSDETLCRVPIIFLTAANSPQDRVAGLNLGAVDYIVKPFHPAEFQARVRAALRTKYLLDLLAHKAQIDGLTGLRNRAFLDEQLAVETAKLQRHGGTLGCIMCDVDHFKEINDLHGHSAGDEVLRCVAEVLQKATRIEDIVARYGGEEFTILTPAVDAVGAAIVAERMRHAIEQLQIRRNGRTITVRCSFGVAEFGDALRGTLLDRADAALYEAKNLGRNRVELYREGMMNPERIAAA